MALKPKIQALIDFANETTEAGDVTLGDAVKTLADGYNGGANVPSAPLVIPSGEMSAKLAALLAYSNEVTGAGDTRMGDAIKTLCEGYGGGEPTPPGVVFYDWAKMTNAWIDTGLKASSKMAVEIVAKRTTNTNIAAFGYRANTGTGSQSWVLFGGSSMYVRWGTSFTVTNSVNTKYRILMDALHGAQTIYLEDGSVFKTQAYTPPEPTGEALTNNLYYGRSNGSSTQYANPANFQYGCKIWDNDVLIRDYRPCTYYGEVGFWDAANEVFCPLAGGTMELGND